jgi:predicted ATPase
VEISEIAKVLVALGCPADKSAEMAAQLDKRARQLAAEKGRSYAEALTHLLKLMKQGWAAQQKGF